MTNLQKQYLLAFLGYDTGGLDGIWGPKSRQAAAQFQSSYMDRSDGVFDEETEKRIRQVIASSEEPQQADFWTRIRYFRRV